LAKHSAKFYQIPEIFPKSGRGAFLGTPGALRRGFPAGIPLHLRASRATLGRIVATAAGLAQVHCVLLGEATCAIISTLTTVFLERLSSHDFT